MHSLIVVCTATLIRWGQQEVIEPAKRCTHVYNDEFVLASMQPEATGQTDLLAYQTANVVLDT